MTIKDIEVVARTLKRTRPAAEPSPEMVAWARVVDEFAGMLAAHTTGWRPAWSVEDFRAACGR